MINYGTGVLGLEIKFLNKNFAACLLYITNYNSLNKENNIYYQNYLKLNSIKFTTPDSAPIKNKFSFK
jgi:hypothetical protein